MLFNGLRLLVTNWRLMLVQALPAMWIWAATVDLKAHVLRGKEFAFIRGPVVLVLFAAVVCTPPYAMARGGIVLLSSSTLFPLGVALLIIGLMLEAGATGAVKAIKVSAKLLAGR